MLGDIFLHDLWNNKNLIFATFSDSLFAENHLLILFNLSLTALNNVFMLLCSQKKKKSVSSGNINETSKFEELGRSFPYNINNNVEPCGTPHLISFYTADLVIFIYGFLPFK